MSGRAIIEPLERRRLFADAPSMLPRPDHVVVVIEENHSYQEIIGNPDAPYMNQLASQGASLTDMHGVTHPSQPNYIAMFSGSTQGVIDNNIPRPLTAPNLGTQLLGKGMSFVGYSQSLPYVGFTGANYGPYARRHVPWVSFPGLPKAVNQPFTMFPADFSKLPTVSYIVPNVNYDMHDGSIATADAWLKAKFDPYVQWAQTHNSLLIVTWDEDDFTVDNHIPTFFVGPMVKQGQYGATLDHFNLLRTVEDMYGLSPLANAAKAAPITDVWATTPTPTPTPNPTNSPPLPRIVSLPTTYRPGWVIAYRGAATDPEDGVLARTSLHWSVEFHHAGEIQELDLGRAAAGILGFFRTANVASVAAGDFYRVTLTAVDSQGASASVSADIYLYAAPVGLKATSASI
jgi:hypothetical protein